LYNPATILKVRNRYWQYYQDTQPVTGRKVYISRAKALRRKVANEQEVIALLKQFGYEIHCMEDLTFTDQVKLMMQSSHLVSIHGAGLTNMLFMQEGSQILELYLDPYRYNKIPFSKSYFRLAGILNHNYYYLFSDPVGNNNTIYDADIVINLDNLKKYLDEVNT
jgi:capsular polysaccharide biosynthesis protein